MLYNIWVRHTLYKRVKAETYIIGNDDYGKLKMKALRRITHVALYLYAFKRGFTFRGRSSTLPPILNLMQSYELFLKLAIGISLFI